ncbi:MAG: Gfo/Idh/MocA family oxidoreductase [Clostridia bacterium]|nr:Gfo/Idh/MocA family oxidoreductase [Clostridia bacterium]
MNKRIRIGIAGIGNTRAIAHDHIQGFLKTSDAEIAALYTRSIDKAYKYAMENHLDCTVCETYEELLDLVDAVVICTIDESHVDLSKRAIAKGVHVLCEKPFGFNCSDALEAARLAKEKGVVNMVGYNFRHLPGLLRMKKMIDGGELGEVFTYRHSMGANRLANIDLQYEWRMDRNQCRAGAIVDFGSHMVDFVFYLISGNTGGVKTVSSQKSTMVRERPLPETGAMKEVTTDDCSSTIMAMENGSLATLSNSRLGTIRDTFEITGSKAMAAYNLDEPEILLVWKKNANGIYAGSPDRIELESQGKTTYEVQARLFIDIINGHAENDRDFFHGGRVLHVLDCMIESSETGNTVSI